MTKTGFILQLFSCCHTFGPWPCLQMRCKWSHKYSYDFLSLWLLECDYILLQVSKIQLERNSFTQVVYSQHLLGFCLIFISIPPVIWFLQKIVRFLNDFSLPSPHFGLTNFFTSTANAVVDGHWKYMGTISKLEFGHPQ